MSPALAGGFLTTEPSRKSSLPPYFALCLAGNSHSFVYSRSIYGAFLWQQSGGGSQNGSVLGRGIWARTNCGLCFCILRYPLPWSCVSASSQSREPRGSHGHMITQLLTSSNGTEPWPTSVQSQCLSKSRFQGCLPAAPFDRRICTPTLAKPEATPTPWRPKVGLFSAALSSRIFVISSLVLLTMQNNLGAFPRGETQPGSSPAWKMWLWVTPDLLSCRASECPGVEQDQEWGRGGREGYSLNGC